MCKKGINNSSTFLKLNTVQPSQPVWLRIFSDINYYMKKKKNKLGNIRMNVHTREKENKKFKMLT